jgi:demethylmenaquinone methyltransferase/2-methoxy-6-polyprenyl-1,4-benzoquinol methylase
MAVSYGYDEVAEGEKQPRVDAVFHNVASRYDVMNDLMSAGLHRVWKQAMVAQLAPPRHAHANWTLIDMAGGTGDIAFRALDVGGENTSAVVCDINSSMLEVGQGRAVKLGLSGRVTFQLENAEKLGFENEKFDAYTIAFGIRNVPRIDLALSEAYRVLKPGGKFLCLEFSDVDVPLLDRLYEQWSFNAIPAIGKVVTGDRASYQYLVESIRKFPNQNRFAGMIAEAGFERVTFRNFSGGIAALHCGRKL